MVFAAVLAGGSGTRMGMALPKQFLPLGDEPILIKTLKVFMNNADVDTVALGIHPDWMEYAAELIEKHIGERGREILLIGGGKDRSETLLNVISRLEQTEGYSEDSVLLTHDAVRPFVTDEMISKSVQTATQYGACTVAFPTVDTLLMSDDGELIRDIPDRKLFWQTQTPQTFKIGMLKELYESLSDDEKMTLTDANKVCLLRGVPVRIIDGSPLNMKITTQDDYKIACAIAAQTEK